MNCKVTGQLFEIIRLLEEEKKRPKDYGNGILLHHGEVMFLEVAARYPHENVSGLSARLAITKGAVTQMSAKLAQKGLIEIVRREDNKKEKYFRLTKLGEESIEGHQAFHKQANQRLCAYFSTLNREQTEVIYSFLHQLKQCVPFCEFPCGCDSINGEEDDYDEAYAAQCARLESGAGNRG